MSGGLRREGRGTEPAAERPEPKPNPKNSPKTRRSPRSGERLAGRDGRSLLRRYGATECHDLTQPQKVTRPVFVSELANRKRLIANADFYRSLHKEN